MLNPGIVIRFDIFLTERTSFHTLFGFPTYFSSNMLIYLIKFKGKFAPRALLMFLFVTCFQPMFSHFPQIDNRTTMNARHHNTAMKKQMFFYIFALNFAITIIAKTFHFIIFCWIHHSNLLLITRGILLRLAHLWWIFLQLVLTCKPIMRSGLINRFLTVGKLNFLAFLKFLRRGKKTGIILLRWNFTRTSLPPIPISSNSFINLNTVLNPLPLRDNFTRLDFLN